MIDLDNLNLGNNKPSTSTGASNVGGEMGLVFVGSQKTQATKPAASVSLPDLYRAKKKLIYLLDRSGSMNCQVAGTDQVKYFIWSPEKMAEIKAAVQTACDTIKAWAAAEAKFMLTCDYTVFDGITASSPYDAKLEQLEGLEDMELKKRILHLGLNRAFLVPYDYTAFASGHSLDTRLALVQKMAEKMVRERKAQFPDSDTQVIAFDDKATLLPASSTEQLIQAIQTLVVGGSTSILRAIKLAMDACNRAPSQVKMHHFVLVTDGEDYDTMNIDKFVPAMVEMGVVLDWIFIANPGDTASRDVATMAIKAAVDATGGTFTIVTSADEFETKFVEASNRKLLPAAKG